MSNTIVHLAVANEILKMEDSLVKNKCLFFIGSIAPDTIGSKLNVTRNDKKRVHLREGISDLDWLNIENMQIFNTRINIFFNNYIKNERDENQKDFNLGYLVHLLLDKWNHKTIRQKMLVFAKNNKVKENDKEFYYMMNNDLEAFDNYILEYYEDIKDLFNVISNKKVEYYLSGYIEKEYLEKSILWWKNEYLSNIKEKKLKYLSYKDINDFIKISSIEIVKEIKCLLN